MTEANFMFENRPEDAGFLLSWIQNPEQGRSSLAEFDAQDLGRGPLAQAQVPELLGLISHRSFALAK